MHYSALERIEKSGFALIEVLVAAAICVGILGAVIGAYLLAINSAQRSITEIQATSLAQEGLEVVRILRDTSWNSDIAPQASNAAFYLSFGTSTWATSSADVYIDSTFERKVVYTDVYRDGSQNITTSGGTLDPDTKLVTVTVSWWNGTATSSRALSSYLTDLFNN